MTVDPIALFWMGFVFFASCCVVASAIRSTKPKYSDPPVVAAPSKVDPAADRIEHDHKLGIYFNERTARRLQVERESESGEVRG